MNNKLYPVDLNNINENPKKIYIKDYYGEEFIIKEGYISDNLIIHTNQVPKIMCSDARRLGIRELYGDERDNGWCEYNIPDEVMLPDAISLDKKAAKELMKVLKNYIN